MELGRWDYWVEIGVDVEVEEVVAGAFGGHGLRPDSGVRAAEALWSVISLLTANAAFFIHASSLLLPGCNAARGKEKVGGDGIRNSVSISLTCPLSHHRPLR